METWPTKGMPKGAWPYEGCIKVGRVDAHWNCLPGLEGDWN